MKKFIEKRFPKKKPKSDSATVSKEFGFLGQIFSTYDSEVVSNSNFDARKSIKYGSNVQAVHGIITEYCEDSTIHGFKYIGDRKRPVAERIIWAIALAFSIYLVYYLISTMWEKRLKSPVIITFDENQTPVWQIPFPTVTFCPETKTNLGLFHFNDVFGKYDTGNYTLTPEEDSYMKALAHVCPQRFFKMICPNGSATTNISEVISAMSRLMLDDVDFKALWRDFPFQRDQFRMVLTEGGTCYSFNSFDPTDVYREEALVEGTVFADDIDQGLEWNLEKGFNSTSSTTFPARTSGIGVKEGLVLSITADPGLSEQLCQDTGHGFKLIINTPGDVPQVSEIFLIIPFNQKVTVSIIPEIVLTSEGVDQYHPDRRRCYFQDERYLKYFKVYTQANCELECLSNLTFDHCGCVKFHMPRDESIPVCDHKNFECHFGVKVLLNNLEFATTGDTNITGCNCLPTCQSILYRAELANTSPLVKLWTDDENRDTAEVTISFKEKSFKALSRSERYTITDFIAGCGGLLGLGMGVSILSLVELLAFLTIRLWINLKMRKKKRQEMKNLKQSLNDRLTV